MTCARPGQHAKRRWSRPVPPHAPAWRQDVTTGPHTIYRALWYIDQDFARRNRLGGMLLNAGHALEETVPKELRKTNPEIRAMVGGKPDDRKVKWTHPLVAKGISDA